MIEYTQENLSEDLIKEIENLLFFQQLELWEDLDEKLNLDWDAYCQMEALDIFVLYTVRDSGSLVGYCSFMVISDPHYIGTMRALQDSIYVLPDWRKKGAGIGIIDYTEKRLVEDFKVKSVQQSVNVKIDFSSLLERKGYEPTEKALVKRFA